MEARSPRRQCARAPRRRAPQRRALDGDRAERGPPRGVRAGDRRVGRPRAVGGVELARRGVGDVEHALVRREGHLELGGRAHGPLQQPAHLMMMMMNYAFFFQRPRRAFGKRPLAPRKPKRKTRPAIRRSARWRVLQPAHLPRVGDEQPRERGARHAARRAAQREQHRREHAAHAEQLEPQREPPVRVPRREPRPRRDVVPRVERTREACGLLWRAAAGRGR